MAAGIAHAADVVMTLVDLLEQPADFLRRVLQIGVERHDHGPARLLEAGEDGIVLAEIAGQQNHAGDIRTFQILGAEQTRGLVATAVVDEDHFVRTTEPLEHRIQPFDELRQHGLLVVDRDHHGKVRSAHR